MALFGWDASHYDGRLSRAILERAKAEGITFFTHKIAEALSDTEGTMDDTALAAARDAGLPFIGGYLVPRSSPTPAAQVARWIQLADAGEPWWRTFPGWMWQIDLERWPYDNVSASVGIDCARRLRAATGRAVILYASKGQYGDSLTAWDGPLWNANYPSSRAAGFASLYPGDSGVGWGRYSGKTPAIWQYTSSATIAGLTTCDANAFRGTVDDFAAMIGGDDMAGEIADKALAHLDGGNALGDVYLRLLTGRDNHGDPSGDGASDANLTEIVARLARLEAAVSKLAATGPVTVEFSAASEAALGDLLRRVMVTGKLDLGPTA